MSIDAASDSPGRGLQSQLAELVACERELDRLLSTAQEEARTKVEEARADAAKAAAAMEAALGEEARRVRSTIQDQARSRARDILDRSRDQAARFEEVSPERVDALAESAFRRLVGLEERP